MEDVFDPFVNDSASGDYFNNEGVETPGDDEYEASREKQDIDDIKPELFDKYIGAEVILDSEHQGNLATKKATVLRRAVGPDGIPLGREHDNPLLDTREYIVEFDDGTQDRYFANTIAENLWSQCDTEGRQFQVISEIVDHRKSAKMMAMS